MKKTPLTRKTPLRARAPTKPRKPMKSRPKVAKDSLPGETFRSRKYLDWVKQQPCVMCGAQADDPHHLIGIGHMGGMGTKAPDSMVMPVCRAHHNEIHHSPELWSQQWEWIARTLDAAMKAGVLEVTL